MGLPEKIESNAAKEAYQAHCERIKSFARLPDNWDGLGTSAPSAQAIQCALFIVKTLFERRLIPDFVNATSDDSIIIQLHRNAQFCLFECFNDGDIVFLSKQDGQREVRDIQKRDIPAIISQISSNASNDLL